MQTSFQQVFQSDTYVYYDLNNLNNGTLDFFIYSLFHGFWQSFVTIG